MKIALKKTSIKSTDGRRKRQATRKSYFFNLKFITENANKREKSSSYCMNTWLASKECARLSFIGFRTRSRSLSRLETFSWART